MKIQTMSIVVGTTACNASCPFCVSKTTPDMVKTKPQDVNWQNFDKALLCAEKSGVQTILLTGEGEPTLYPDLITDYLKKIDNRFPFIELQTNGILLDANPKKYDPHLKEWRKLGLNTICISVVHHSYNANREIYTPKRGYMRLNELVEKLHRDGFTVRLTCMLLDGYIDSVAKFEEMIDFCKTNSIKQFTARPIARPPNNTNDVTDWIRKHTLHQEQVLEISQWLNNKNNATQVMRLAHGAVVYDVDGQNVCWSNCLTDSTDPEDIRQLIFFPDGTLGWDWKYQGAVLL